MGEKQRGVALLTAMLVVALATIVAGNLVWGAYLDQRRTAALLYSDQAMLYALGAEAWASEILKQDREESEIDFLGEEWAFALPPLPIEGGVIQGQLEDLQGRFNINNLIDAGGVTSPAGVRQFERLLVGLGIDPQLAGRAADWLDRDAEPGFPSGAEDDAYTSLDLPYRTANTVVTSASELLAVEGFNAEIFAILEPFVTALPTGTPINVNTASAPVIQALASDITLADAQAAVLEREQSGFTRLEDFARVVDANIETQISLDTQYLRLAAFVTLGTVQFTMYSLLARDASGYGRPILRSFGSQ